MVVKGLSLAKAHAATTSDSNPATAKAYILDANTSITTTSAFKASTLSEMLPMKSFSGAREKRNPEIHVGMANADDRAINDLRPELMGGRLQELSYSVVEVRGSDLQVLKLILHYLPSPLMMNLKSIIFHEAKEK